MQGQITIKKENDDCPGIEVISYFDEEQEHLQIIHSFYGKPWMTIEIRKMGGVIGIFAGFAGKYKTPNQWKDSDLLWKQ